MHWLQALAPGASRAAAPSPFCLLGPISSKVGSGLRP